MILNRLPAVFLCKQTVQVLYQNLGTQPIMLNH